jgi:intraflagellar transport protein 88
VVCAVPPDFQSGFNLVVCYYALGDADRMRRGFSKLLSIPPPSSEEEDVSRAAAHSRVML